jgi:hypothetical protein
MRLVQPEHMGEYSAQCFIGDYYHIASDAYVIFMGGVAATLQNKLENLRF